jgi:transcription antitermination protein NusB
MDGKKGARRAAREAALQVLFWLDGSEFDVDEALLVFFRQFEFEAEGREHAEELARGVRKDTAALDTLITQASQNWRLERMSRLDRNLLRLGAWELSARTDIPRTVILDEAVDIAKTFGTDESGAFVNGVLNRIADLLKRVDTDR